MTLECDVTFRGVKRFHLNKTSKVTRNRGTQLSARGVSGHFDGLGPFDMAVARPLQECHVSLERRSPFVK